MLTRLLMTAIVIGSLALPPRAARAQSDSVKTLFEKHNLIGAFSWDCGKPPDAGNNWHFVNRVLNNRVERTFMASATKIGWSSVITKAEELGPNEISVSLVRNGKPTIGVWRIERSRMLQWQAEEDGKTLIADGKWMASGKQLPWLNKCGNR